MTVMMGLNSIEFDSNQTPGAANSSLALRGAHQNTETSRVEYCTDSPLRDFRFLKIPPAPTLQVPEGPRPQLPRYRPP